MRTLPLHSGEKLHLKGFPRAALEHLLQQWGQPRYRAVQLMEWLYAKGVEDFTAMTTLPQELRRHLATECTLQTVHAERWEKSQRDGTVKFLFRLPDGAAIESVLIPAEDSEGRLRRLTLCVSTQVGCPLSCVFCATASLRLRRNLNAAEIVDQLLQVQRLTGLRVTNLVFMGMGEPLLNLEAVLQAVHIWTDPHSGLLSPRRITLSTAGLVPEIYRLAEDTARIRLAISLHTTDQALRERLMPIARRYPLQELQKAARYYVERTKRPITYEYILFDHLNDSPTDADALARFVRVTPRAKVNLIPFHPIEFVHPTGIAATLRPSPPERIHAFRERLRSHGIPVMLRSSSGIDIKAACGQLALSGERTVTYSGP
ncbi:MAG: 23S rRNA (adenine(2503)-C(2))-methyltransferase RlmN [Candidatus Kapabacteria bacterium]|nr:23S rRNA (adenine(2503)-C(2))-methyltransferase RlmN [Candidatus Kapabacteria bacterium]MCS7170068.1 23S rRNA (adenine(2503)-C(2))-methyltransferase RlmN [Candidatus Kapabacteria bacterium]MDW7997661.1 23S rRNA (adenine(2503)-C(2))-methyltransferase RlmN [Bacteroidota bacterium]MDW8224913.1 23S rRNA (adenine(2503)-C(2))-methyltransferase RlmN [Bacteroidota bacterium]